MSIEAFANSRVGRLFIRVMATLMESRFRCQFSSPERVLQGADIHPGQIALELGCGTGFFTTTAAQLIGNQGSLVAMDILPASVETVSEKVQTAGLKNVSVVKGDALNTKLDDENTLLSRLVLEGNLPEAKRSSKSGFTEHCNV